MNAVSTVPVTQTIDLLTGMEWSPAQVRSFLQLAADVKAHPDRYRGALAGRFLALIFEKPSLRTRVTFEVGVASLGGACVFLDHTVSHLGERESIPDVAKSLERWVHAIVARVFKQEALDQLAANANVPVINALSDLYHPCQALSDFFTLEERFGNLRGLKLAYVGDGNNMCNSLMSIAGRLGVHLRVATPEDFEPNPDVVSEAKRMARETRGKIELFHSPEEAVAGAQAIYTDVWTSMGQEEEAKVREAAFSGYQVNEALFAGAAADAIFMHCLPAHRGSEVSEGIMESPRSIVFEQAENRLHVQKAILLTLLN
ncbi:MAG: ornithine carbamoyltransferase [Candidatus Acidiferrales bacterium]